MSRADALVLKASMGEDKQVQVRLDASSTVLKDQETYNIIGTIPGTEEGMILRKRAEEILDLVRKTENEISLSNDVIAGDVCIGTGESNIIRILRRRPDSFSRNTPTSTIIFPAAMRISLWTAG